MKIIQNLSNTATETMKFVVSIENRTDTFGLLDRRSTDPAIEPTGTGKQIGRQV